MIKISVIIPIYNSEAYIEKCVSSVLNQTEKNIEVILVDDGSVDNSLKICKKISLQDDRVVVLHQENSGVSAARNKGISFAKGKYIGFVDSDDWIAPNMYEKMLCEAEKTSADIVMCDAETVYSNGNTQADTITQLPKNQILKKSDFSPFLLLEMAGSAWRCIYKNNRYSAKQCKQQFAFPLGVKFSEDRIFNLYAFGFAEKISYLKEPYYYRFINSKSAVHRFHYDYFEMCKAAAVKIDEAIEVAWDNKPEYKIAYSNQLIQGAMSAICNYYYKTSPLNLAEKRAMVKRICSDNMLIETIKTYGADRKSRFILNKNYSLLIAYAKLANLKHRR